MTSGWDGQKMRYNKDKNCLEFEHQEGTYKQTEDHIIKVDITD